MRRMRECLCLPTARLTAWEPTPSAPSSTTLKSVEPAPCGIGLMRPKARAPARAIATSLAATVAARASPSSAESWRSSVCISPPMTPTASSIPRIPGPSALDGRAIPLSRSTSISLTPTWPASTRSPCIHALISISTAESTVRIFRRCSTLGAARARRWISMAMVW